MDEKEINNAKKELANLYLILKLGNKNEVNYAYYYIIILLYLIEKSEYSERKRTKWINEKAIKRFSWIYQKFNRYNNLNKIKWRIRNN